MKTNLQTRFRSVKKNSSNGRERAAKIWNHWDDRKKYTDSMIPHSYRKTSEDRCLQISHAVEVILTLSKFPSPFLCLLWEKYKDLVSVGFFNPLSYINGLKLGQTFHGKKKIYCKEVVIVLSQKLGNSAASQYLAGNLKLQRTKRSVISQLA